MLIAVLLFSNFNSVFAFDDQNLSGSIPFDVNAKSAILMDSDTGTVLYEKNIHERLAPASVTKIMTLYLIMEAIDSGKIKLDDMVRVSEYASSMGGSQVYLAPGEEMSVEDLIKAITIASANDAAVALAEYIAGSEQLFVEMMNDAVSKWGLKDTHFVNVTGLPTDNHYTSVYDTAIISMKLINEHPSILKYTSIWMDTLREGKFGLANTNKLIRTYGADGLKTGSTEEAKYCLSATKKVGNTRLIAVLFGAPDSKTRFGETIKLLDYGFANYETYNLFKKGDLVGKINVEKGSINIYEIRIPKDISILIKKGEGGNIVSSVELVDKIVAPAKVGYEIGKIIIKNKGEVIQEIPLTTEVDIQKATFSNIIKKIYKCWLTF
ncbi:D-alanyl-D-alanine carboxypeptidase [Calorimonas adulescens]|uniref:serine-type D-Ala-D-Ala carboxypeptidase n=2 Tax=Calorimonas adulescens TaxID=2606906 RepID=A0A5D8QBZ0_9THEO|nr:D-alanyl-D-alanine carboxypeptidase [Calorimonas adulescens]